MIVAQSERVGRSRHRQLAGPCPPLSAPFGFLAGHIQLHSFCHFVKKSAFICEIHPPQYCPPSAMLLCPSSVAELLRREERTGYGGRVCGSDPTFKNKKPSQYVPKIGKPKQGKASVFAPPPGGCPGLVLYPLCTGLGTQIPLFLTILPMFQLFNSCHF